MYIHPVPPVLNETRALVMMYNDFYRQAIQDLQGNVCTALSFGCVCMGGSLIDWW